MRSEEVERLPKSRHYKVRKEIVWLFFASLFLSGIYLVADWWLHLNWPPHDATHLEQLRGLGCPTDERYVVTADQIEGVPKHSIGGGSLNRKIYFEEPQCAAGQYLAFEGSGVRIHTYVYDVEKKRRTATIVTTFDKYQGE